MLLNCAMFGIIAILLTSVYFCHGYDKAGYLVYCPCMGRFGNQADHFLGALAFSKAINRTLILPPWVEYRYGEAKSTQVQFDKYFRVDAIQQYHRALTMETFMNEYAEEIWPQEQRISFCYMKRTGDIENNCNAKSGNPFGPFWDTFNIDFDGSEFYGPMHYDAHNEEMMIKWRTKYLPNKWPVLAFTGAPASFPVQKENLELQKHLQWSNEILEKANNFIKENLYGGSYVGIHLRNGQDWVRACEHIKDSPLLFAAPQCVGYKNERGPLTSSMCFPDKTTIIRQLKRAFKKIHNAKYVFVASDSNHMVQDIKEAVNKNIQVVTMVPSNPHIDLAILGRANYFIGNCVSSFTAFVKRERDVNGLPSEFWSYPDRKKSKHEDL